MIDSSGHPLPGLESNADWDHPILVGGCPSSGTTLLSVMLDSHPAVACGPELALFSHPFFWRLEGQEWRDRLQRYLALGYRAIHLQEWTLVNGCCPYAGPLQDDALGWYGTTPASFRESVQKSSGARDLIRYLYAPVLSAHGKRIWAEKSPTNLYSFQAFLDYFPKGKAVCLVRDGRDVVCSLLRRQWGSFKKALSTWLVETSICESYRHHPRVFVIRYEDLVLNPRKTIGDLLDFLELSPDIDRMLNYPRSSSRVGSDPTLQKISSWQSNPCQPISTKSLGVWRIALSPEQIWVLSTVRIVEEVPDYPCSSGRTVAELLEQFGYEPSKPSGPAGSTLRRLIRDEGFFLSGDDYDDPRVFHERFVECDPSVLPKLSRPWEEERLLAKIDHRQAAWQARLAEVQRQVNALQDWRAQTAPFSEGRIASRFSRLLVKLLSRLRS